MRRVCFLLLLGLALAGTALASDVCLPASQDEAKAMALKAVAHLQKIGPKKAFRDLQDPGGSGCAPYLP